jgi:hypothetical protein
VQMGALVTAGLSRQHVGTALRGDGQSRPLPALTRVTVGARLIESPSRAVRAGVDIVRTDDADLRVGGGIQAEASVGSGLRVRASAGLRRTSALHLDGPWTAGAGVGGDHLAIDYAVASLRVAGDLTHRLGLRWAR